MAQNQVGHQQGEAGEVLGQDEECAVNELDGGLEMRDELEHELAAGGLGAGGGVVADGSGWRCGCTIKGHGVCAVSERVQSFDAGCEVWRSMWFQWMYSGPLCITQDEEAAAIL